MNSRCLSPPEGRQNPQHVAVGPVRCEVTAVHLRFAHPSRLWILRPPDHLPPPHPHTLRATKRQNPHPPRCGFFYAQKPHGHQDADVIEVWSVQHSWVKIIEYGET